MFLGDVLFINCNKGVLFLFRIKELYQTLTDEIFKIDLFIF